MPGGQRRQSGTLCVRLGTARKSPVPIAMPHNCSCAILSCSRRSCRHLHGLGAQCLDNLAAAIQARHPKKAVKIAIAMANSVESVPVMRTSLEASIQDQFTCITIDACSAQAVRTTTFGRTRAPWGGTLCEHRSSWTTWYVERERDCLPRIRMR